MSDVERIADIDLIKRILPHRYPFLLVDKVVDIAVSYTHLRAHET